MFREQKKIRKGDEELVRRQEVDSTSMFFGNSTVDPPGANEIAINQDKIQALITKRYNDEDNSFLQITEMNKFEQIAIYKDAYPLFNLRMRLWMGYM